MFAMEMKILILTGVYFLGWFLFEKVFSRLWEHFVESRNDSPVPDGTNNRGFSLRTLQVNGSSGKPTSADNVAPLDQTGRYLKGLKSPDWRVRRISCIQLADKRGGSVVQGLIHALRDSREEVSLAAGESLAKIGDPNAIAALTNHVQALENSMDESYERSRAA
ncbi:MAG: HEAT repeat domain-containing protein [Candidatus Ozemobacteraceae bacterium]